MKKIREIKNECKHEVGYLYCLDYQEPYSYSEYTSGGGNLIINQYCKNCRDQMGYLFIDDSSNIGRLEFSSKELDEWFSKRGETK